MEINHLMVMALSGPTDRMTEIVARDLFLDALDDSELTFQINAQCSQDLDSVFQIALYMEDVMRMLPSHSGQPVQG